MSLKAKIEYPNWGGALDYIKTCIKEGLLETEGSFMEHIKRDDLKSFLASENIIIEGFNNNFKPINFIEKEQLILQRVELNDEKINVENANLSELVAKQKLEIEQLKKDIANERAISLSSCIDKNKAEKEVAKLQEHIKQLESEQTLEKSDQSKLLSLIFDESATERYAPDLVLSIKLWESIYINNPKNDSHSNKANSWITMNTGYDLSRPSATKLREITTPLVNWSTLRDRNYKK
ncbi:Atg14 domain-containing protein [Acinetobacter lactucae]